MEKYRLDKWLWAARFYKTRSLATQAVNGGKVTVNGQRAKAGKEVNAGMTVKIRQGVFTREVVISALSDRRGPASQAQALYQETEQSRHDMALTRERIKLQKLIIPRSSGKPDKHERKKIIRFRRNNNAG